jgi:hypothetical protein
VPVLEQEHFGAIEFGRRNRPLGLEQRMAGRRGQDERIVIDLNDSNPLTRGSTATIAPSSVPSLIRPTSDVVLSSVHLNQEIGICALSDGWET